MFGVEFDGQKDCNSVGEKKMDKVCQIQVLNLLKNGYSMENVKEKLNLMTLENIIIG